MRWYKLLAHEDDSRLGYFFNKTLAADTTLALVRTTPGLLAAKRYFRLLNRGHIRAMVVPFYFGILEVLSELLCLSIMQFLDWLQLWYQMFR